MRYLRLLKLPLIGLGLLISTQAYAVDYARRYPSDTPLAVVTSGTTAAASASSLTMNTARLLGRTTASVGSIEEISIGSGLTLSAGSLSASGGGGSPGGSNTQVQYNNSSAFGGISGAVTPDGVHLNLTAPDLGAATATTINLVSLTRPASGATITMTTGKTLSVTDFATLSGANTGDQTNISGNAATVTTNANLTGPIISTGNATSIAAQTGTGTTFVMQASPTLTTPNIGAATATTINLVSLTRPASGSTLTLATGKTFTMNNNLTFSAAAGADNSTQTFQATDTIVGRATTDELTNKTLTSSVGKGTWTASGTWTMPAMTFGGLVTLAQNILFGENTELQLDTALSADGKYCGVTEIVTAGETIAFGDIVYLKAADSQWYLADADADASAGAVRIAIAVTSGTDNNTMTIMTYGKIRADANFPTLTVGAPVYVSTTSGDVQTAQPSGTDDVVRIVGHANTTDELLFNPSDDYITHT